MPIVRQQTPNQPMPPKNPLGELDPKKSREFTFAGTVNGLWKAFREGKAVHESKEAWRKTYEELMPHAKDILEWLRSWIDSGGGPTTT